MDKLIDGKKKLKPTHIDEFKQGLNDDTVITMYIDQLDVFFQKKLKDMQDFFKDESIEANVQSDECVITFLGESNALEILGIDYKWWIAPVRGKKYARLNKLFNLEQDFSQKVDKADKPAKQSNIIYKCACGIKKDNVVTDIEKFEGTQKEMTAFVNKLFARNQVRTFFRGVIVFCVNYKYESDLDDINNWFTLSELSDKGVFVK